MRQRLIPAVLLATLTSFLHGATPLDFYIGTYTGSDSQGIYQARLDPETGALSQLQVVGETANPSFLARHPKLDLLYSVSEVRAAGGRQGAAVVAWKIDPSSGKLTELGRVPSGGDGPCHVAVAPDGRHVAVANYGGGSVTLLPLDAQGQMTEGYTVQHQGGSGVVANRQEGPHAHCVTFSHNGKFLLATDLGLDRVLVYAIRDGKLEPAPHPYAATTPGDGPRHMALTADGNWLLVINELANTVTSYRFDQQSGALTKADTVSTLPQGWSGSNTTAEIRIHPNGRFVYGSNRGHDSIAVMTFDNTTGNLQVVEITEAQVRVPRNFNLLAGGQWLLAAGQESGDLVSFRVDPGTGRLSATNHRLEVGRPVCIAPRR